MTRGDTDDIINVQCHDPLLVTSEAVLTPFAQMNKRAFWIRHIKK
jgi:hypothetical protein